MIDPADISDLVAGQVCESVVATVEELQRVEARQLFLAVHGADLDSPDWP